MRKEKRSYFGFLIMKNKLYFEKIENESKGVRLFCFSYAGGGASVFRSWQNKLGDEISVCPAHYPGHEERIFFIESQKAETNIMKIWQKM